MKKNTYNKLDALAIKNSPVAAALMEITGHARFDSADAAAVFFARELDAIKAKSYDVQYPQLMALSLSRSMVMRTPVLRPLPTTPMIWKVWLRSSTTTPPICPVRM